MGRGIDYSMIVIKKNSLSSLEVASADWFQEKTVRSFARVAQSKDAVPNSFPALPRRAHGSGRRGCVPVNAEGYRGTGTRMEARRGLVTATEPEGVADNAEDMLRTG